MGAKRGGKEKRGDEREGVYFNLSSSLTCLKPERGENARDSRQLTERPEEEPWREKGKRGEDDLTLFLTFSSVKGGPPQKKKGKSGTSPALLFSSPLERGIPSPSVFSLKTTGGGGRGEGEGGHTRKPFLTASGLQV